MAGEEGEEEEGEEEEENTLQIEATEGSQSSLTRMVL